MEFSRPEYWSEQPFPSPRDLLNPGIESRSPALQADSLSTELPGKPIVTIKVAKKKKKKSPLNPVLTKKMKLWLKKKVLSTIYSFRFISCL